VVTDGPADGDPLGAGEQADTASATAASTARSLAVGPAARALVVVAVVGERRGAMGRAMLQASAAIRCGFVGGLAFLNRIGRQV
jgi:hypothetical protein